MKHFPSASTLWALSGLLVLSSLGFIGCSSSGWSGSAEGSKPQVVLFGSNEKGKPLAWVVMHGGEWTLGNDELVGRLGRDWSTDPEKSGSWLRTAQEYSDFVLELEYAINTKGNSGIFFWSALEKNPAFTGHEMQILDDHDREVPTIRTTGALYEVVAASENRSKPAGEWNQVRMEVRGPRVQIWMNDVQIIDHESTRSRKGYIGFQNHDDHSEVRFRNVRLQKL